MDTIESHKAWEADIERAGNFAIKFPIIADPNHKISDMFGMIHENIDSSVTVRNVYIIDQLKKIRLITTYPVEVGRNFDEVLRVLDAL